MLHVLYSDFVVKNSKILVFVWKIKNHKTINYYCKYINEVEINA